MEIGTALRRDIRVIPVLVDGALMPWSTDLPEDLRSLVRRNALSITDISFEGDCQRLVAAIKVDLQKAAAKEQQRLEAEQGEKERLEAEQRERERREAERRGDEKEERLEHVPQSQLSSPIAPPTSPAQPEADKAPAETPKVVHPVPPKLGESEAKKPPPDSSVTTPEKSPSKRAIAFLAAAAGLVVAVLIYLAFPWQSQRPAPVVAVTPSSPVIATPTAEEKAPPTQAPTPPIAGFKVIGGVRTEASKNDYYTFVDSLLDSSHPNETTDPLLKIEGRLEKKSSFRNVEELNVVVKANNEEILAALGKAEMENFRKYKVAVQTDGNFDSGASPITLFPGKNTVTISTVLEGRPETLEEFPMELKPSDHAELWAWLYWTESSADLDLHVKSIPFKKGNDIFWKNSDPKIAGFPGKMLSWSTRSGIPEVFVLDNSPVGIPAGYAFFAMPNPEVTSDRLQKEGKLDPAKLLFVLWTREKNAYRTEFRTMTFENFPNEIPEVKFGL
jgi:hypothetical protein